MNNPENQGSSLSYLDGLAVRESMQAFTRMLVGTETRLIGALYLQRASILAFVTITIVVALDISVNFQSVMSLDSREVGRDGFGRLIYYAFLRVSFVSPSVLLFAGVWGIVWAEYSLSVSRERIMIFNCGHSYLFSLVPALLVGIVIGMLQFTVVAFVKPMTVELEATTTHRNYGPKFERPTVTPSIWISGNGFILNARIKIAEAVSLEDAYLYKIDGHGGLEKIITSTRAEPTDMPSIWKFHQVTLREFSTNTTTPRTEGADVSDQQIAELDARLLLNSIWLENYQVLPSLLPHSILTTLVSKVDGVPHLYKYQMAIQERYASILYCLATVLLSAYLALAKFPPNMLPYRALGVAFIGFGAYFLFSISLMLGHFGYLPVLIAAWGIPILIATIFIGLLVCHIRRVRIIVGTRGT